MEDKEQYEDDEENPEDDTSEEGDDGINHDEIILGNTTDVILYLGRAYGDLFAPTFEAVYPLLMEYTSDKHPKSDRNMIIGTIGDVFSSCNAVIPKYYNDFLALLNANSGTKDSKLNRNIAFAIGILAEHA